MLYRDRVLAAIDAEEEMPGEMPEGIYTWLKSLDKEATERFLRSIVSLTKYGIRKRVEEL